MRNYPDRNQRPDDITADPEQISAIRHFTGPCLVTAGPGSGKTHVLTNRILYLVSEQKVPPESILVLTFSRDAARQMRRRYLSIAPVFSSHVTFSTIHSFCYSLLRAARRHPPALITEKDRKVLLESLLERAGVNDLLPEDLEDGIRRLRSIPGSPECPVSPEREEMQLIFREYTAYLEARNLMDFDDMVTGCLALLEEDENLAAGFRSRYRFVLVDEFQDVSPAQFEVIKQICPPAGNLFAVGDDDQSIYGFRGASPHIFDSFLAYYEHPARITLNVNYRCPRKVVLSAGKLIAHNRSRIPKNITCGSAVRGHIAVASFRTREAQYSAVCRSILAEREKDGGSASAAILVRTSAQVRRILKVMKNAGLPADTGASFNNRKTDPVQAVHRDILSYLEAAQHISGKGVSVNILDRILNKPERFLKLPHALTVKDAAGRVSGREILQADAAGPFPDPELARFLYMLAFAGKLTPARWLVYILKTLGYENYLRKTLPQYAEESSTSAGFLAEVKGLCARSSSLQELYEQLSGIDMKKETANAVSGQKKGAGLMVMTMHSAKGLEFDSVYLPDLNEGIIPSRAAGTAEAAEEERRLFYVALTRAKKNLFLGFVDGSDASGLPPSRFLFELGLQYTPESF